MKLKSKWPELSYVTTAKRIVLIGVTGRNFLPFKYWHIPTWIQQFPAQFLCWILHFKFVQTSFFTKNHETGTQTTGILLGNYSKKNYWNRSCEEGKLTDLVKVCQEYGFHQDFTPLSLIPLHSFLFSWYQLWPLLSSDINCWK
jgi:hypothetical protein